jgi:CRISPR-associated protein Csh1
MAKAEELFGSQFVGQWALGFREIAHLFPVHRRRRTPSEWSSLVELYSAILGTTRYPIDQLIRRGVLLARIHRYVNYGSYNLRAPPKPDLQLVQDVVKFNILLRYLEDVEVVQAGSLKQTQQSQILASLPDELLNWMKLVRYDAEQQALFLLGVLVGKIGTAQFKKGDKKKAVLDRLRFEGMDFDRVRDFANRLLDSLHVYRLLSKENETIYGCAMALLNENAQDWSKGPEENVFYILSGYGFMTLTNITKASERGEQNLAE